MFLVGRVSPAEFRLAAQGEVFVAKQFLLQIIVPRSFVARPVYSICHEG